MKIRARQLRTRVVFLKEEKIFDTSPLVKLVQEWKSKGDHQYDSIKHILIYFRRKCQILILRDPYNI